MKHRRNSSQGVEAAVLTRSRRRCCICFGLHRDVEVKPGQIAHLDGDRSNSTADNLAFLCFEHHDQYDSTTSQSKNLIFEEVKTYRAELYDKVLPVLETRMVRTQDVSLPAPKLAKLPFDADRRNELKTIAIEVISEMHGILRSVHHLAHRLTIATQTTERLLFELVQEGKLRVDRPSGTVRKTYSLVTAPENRLIDTFKSQLGSTPISDERFICRRQYELDAVIQTQDGTKYAIETMCVGGRVLREVADSRIRRLVVAKQQIGIPDAIGVLLIGITGATKRSDDDLKTLEQTNLLIRYVELEHPQYKDFEASFRKSMDEVKIKAISTGLTSASPNESSSRLLPQVIAKQIERISEISPRAGISEAWAVIEGQITALANKCGLQQSKRKSVMSKFGELVQVGVIKSDLRPIYDELREIRNNAIHVPDFVVTPMESQRYHFWAGVLYSELTKILEKKGKNPNKRLEPTL